MKVQVGWDKSVDGDAVGFVPMTEPWSEYHLDDGVVLRFRATAFRIIKLREKGPDGTDVYVVQHSQQVVVNGGRGEELG